MTAGSSECHIGEQARVRELEGEVERLRAEVAKLRKADLFWIDEDPESGYNDPWEATETALYHSGDQGIAAIREGRELGVRYYAYLRADDEIEADDWQHDFDTREAAELALKAERDRRAALSPGTHPAAPACGGGL